MTQKFSIRLQGLRQSIRLGWYDAERSHPQVVELDVSLELENADIGCRDNLEGTVDYEAVVGFISRVLQSREWRVVEHLITCLSDHILDEFLEVDAVELVVRKRALDSLECAAFQGTRYREERG